MQRVLVILVVVAVIIGLAFGAKYANDQGWIDTSGSSSSTTSTSSSSTTSGTTSVLALSVDMKRLQDRIGPERCRHNSYRFAVHLDASRLGEGWRGILDPVAKKLFVTDPAERARITRFIRDVEGVTLVSHEKGNVFTHCVMQFVDHKGHNRRLVAPLHNDPGLVRETTNFVLNVTDDEAIATAVAAAIGGV